MKRQLGFLAYMTIIMLVLVSCGKQEVNLDSNIGGIDKNPDEIIELVKSRPVFKTDFFREGVTYGDILDEKYFVNCTWEVEESPTDAGEQKMYHLAFGYQGAYTSIKNPELSDNGIILADSLVIYEFLCSEDGTTFCPLRITAGEEDLSESFLEENYNGELTDESMIPLVSYLTDYIEVNAWMLWVDEELKAEQEECLDDQVIVDTENNESASFEACPFSAEAVAGAEKRENWYDNGVFATYVESVYPNQIWEYYGTTTGDIDPNPYDYNGYDVYQVDNYDQYLWFVVPHSEHISVPLVYAYDMASNSMKLVFREGEVF